MLNTAKKYFLTKYNTPISLIIQIYIYILKILMLFLNIKRIIYKYLK